MRFWRFAQGSAHEVENGFWIFASSSVDVAELVVELPEVRCRFGCGVVEAKLLKTELTNVRDAVVALPDMHDDKDLDVPSSKATWRAEVVPDVNHLEASQDLVKASLQHVAAGEDK
jgi:hypothetical protein